jgi:hypothetical protein
MVWAPVDGCCCIERDVDDGSGGAGCGGGGGARPWGAWVCAGHASACAVAVGRRCALPRLLRGDGGRPRPSAPLKGWAPPCYRCIESGEDAHGVHVAKMKRRKDTTTPHRTWTSTRAHTHTHTHSLIPHHPQGHRRRPPPPSRMGGACTRLSCGASPLTRRGWPSQTQSS